MKLPGGAVSWQETVFNGRRVAQAAALHLAYHPLPFHPNPSIIISGLCKIDSKCNSSAQEKIPPYPLTSSDSSQMKICCVFQTIFMRTERSFIMDMKLVEANALGNGLKYFLYQGILGKDLGLGKTTQIRAICGKGSFT